MHKVPFPYMEMFWKVTRVRRPNTITEDDELCDKMLNCLKEFDWVDNNRKSLVMVGPAGCGKTNWAKIQAPKPCLFINHLDALRGYDPEYHKSIIFDDMSFTHLVRNYQIYLLDRENARDIHIRYKVAHIPALVPKFFTANIEPFTRGDAALERRRHTVNINTKFFQRNATTDQIDIVEEALIDQENVRIIN